MTRRRWVYRGTEVIEVGIDYTPESRNSAGNAGILWNDRDYQDMGDPRFSSRSQHREFMKAKGLTTVDDFRETWKGNEKTRVETRQGVDPGRKHDIGYAINRVANGYKPNILKE